MLGFLKSACFFLFFLTICQCGGPKGLVLSDSEGDSDGGGDSSDSSGSSDSSDNTDAADDVTTDTITTETSGDNTQTPTPTEISDNNITLNCTNRDAGDSSDADFITVTCGEGDGAAEVVYYCDSETVVKEGGDDADTDLYTITTIECTVADDGSGTIVEEETIVG